MSRADRYYRRRAYEQGAQDVSAEILDTLELLDANFRRYIERRPTFNLDEALAESDRVLKANGRKS